MKKLRENLITFGLTDKEADVYLALLTLGTALGAEIAELSKINRSTTYLLLDQLAKKGLVSITEEDGKVRKFTAAPPDRIVHLLEESLSKYTELLHVADEIVPELKKIQETKKKEELLQTAPGIQLYEGVAGLKTAYEDMLQTKDDIRTYASEEDVHELLPNYFPKYYKRRAEKGIKMRVIFPKLSNAKERTRELPRNINEARMLTKEKSFGPEINIYGNKIAFISIKEKFGLIIESRELSNALRSIFEISWLAAKKLSLSSA